MRTKILVGWLKVSHSDGARNFPPKSMTSEGVVLHARYNRRLQRCGSISAACLWINAHDSFPLNINSEVYLLVGERCSLQIRCLKSRNSLSQGSSSMSWSSFLRGRVPPESLLKPAEVGKQPHSTSLVPNKETSHFHEKSISMIHEVKLFYRWH